MIQREGQRKNDWEIMLAMISNIRDQYIIDRYLKKDKNKPEKYQKNFIFKNIQKDTPKQEGITDEKYKKILKKKLQKYLDNEFEDFSEIVQLKIFTKDNLAKYYAIRGDKAPTELDQNFEKILFKTSQKNSQKPIINPGSSKDEPIKQIAKKSKINLENKKEMKKYFDELEKKEASMTKSQKNEELVKLGYLLEDLSLDDKGILREMKSLYNKFKKQLQISKEKEQIITPKELPLWKREMDAKNYKNEIYKKNEAVKDLRYKNRYNIYNLEKDISNLVISPKRKGSKNLEKIRQRLYQINEEEKQIKNKKKIKLIEIPQVPPSKVKQQTRKRKKSIDSPSLSLLSLNSSINSSESSTKSLSTPYSSTSEMSQSSFY